MIFLNIFFILGISTENRNLMNSSQSSTCFLCAIYGIRLQSNIKNKSSCKLAKKNMETEQSTHCSRFLSTGEEKIKEFYFFKFLYINLINFSTVQPA